MERYRWEHRNTKKRKKDLDQHWCASWEAQNSSSYRVATPIAKFLEHIRVITKYKKIDHYIFTNQDSDKQISERIWQDSIADLLVEARLVDWREATNSQVKKVVIHSGKNITWYSFHHAFISWGFHSQQLQPTHTHLWNISKGITSITELMSLEKFLERVEISSQQQKV